MGFLSKLFKASKDIIAEAAVDAIASEQRNRDTGIQDRDKAYFRKILQEEYSRFELKEDVSAETLGWRWAAEFRDREQQYPHRNFDFVLLEQNIPKVLIMVTEPNQGAKAIFKNTSATARYYGVPLVNFYTHFPSERSYVIDRIGKLL